MASDVNHSLHVLICHIHIPSSVKCHFVSFDHFLIGLFAFLLLSFQNSLYILDMYLLAEMWFANIFSQSGLYFHFLMGSLENKSF